MPLKSHTLLLLNKSLIYEVSKWLFYSCLCWILTISPELDISTSTSQAHNEKHSVSIRLLLRRWHIKFSATCQKCRRSVDLCDRIRNSSVPDFYSCTPVGFAVVASSTVIVFLFSSVHGLCTVRQFLTVFLVIGSWAKVNCWTCFKGAMCSILFLLLNWTVDVTIQTLPLMIYYLILHWLEKSLDLMTLVLSASFLAD